MSTEIDRIEPDPNPMAAETDSPLFPETPIWDRAGRKRGGGAQVAKEPRSFAATDSRSTIRPGPVIADRSLGFTPVLPTMEADETDPALMAPIGRTRVAAPPSRSGAGGAVVIAGFAAVAVAAAGGWYLMQNRDPVPELVPGVVEIAAAQPMAAPPTALAPPRFEAAPPAAAPAATQPARVERRFAAPRARPAASNAAASGVNASAVLPDAPLPYGAVNGSTAAPAPSIEAAPPEPIPSTPPAAPDAAPSPAPETTSPLTAP